MVSLLRAVAEPRRQEILRYVWKQELCAGDIAARFDVTFGAVSQHLRVLREAGLVTVRRDGRRRLYRALPEALGPLRQMLEAMWAEPLHRLKTLAEKRARGESR